MKKDEILEAAGCVERKRRVSASDDPWRALTAGELSDDAVRALLETAGETPAGRRRAELYRPLDQGLADRVMLRLGVEPEAEVIPFPPRRRRRRLTAGVLAGLAAAAASVTIYVVSSSSPVSIPLYKLDMSGGDRPVRAVEVLAPKRPRFALDSFVEILVRPAEPTDSDVGARVFVRSGGAVQQAPTTAERSEEGVFRVGGPVSEALGIDAPGDYEILLAVGVPDDLPDVAAVAAALADAAGDEPTDWQLLRADFTISPKR